MERFRLTRRAVLSGSSAALAAHGAASAQSQCGVYVEADAGPFYPAVSAPYHADLTLGPGGARAAGQALHIVGSLSDTGCSPIANADILIWQADAHGQYKHPNAEITVGLDPNFQYFAKVKTDAKGLFHIKTILPRWYQFRNLQRAAHIHFGFKPPDGREWLTEMYFAGDQDDERRAKDVVWTSRNRAMRNHMIVELQNAAAFSDSKNEFETGSLVCRYDVMIG